MGGENYIGVDKPYWYEQVISHTKLTLVSHIYPSACKDFDAICHFAE